MDYDDNDFQSQNLHLAGEGSAKFPPALRPYALSKFDFDESLQGNLRFDSLVETEVFLGIESNEDNQWIDDFSRGSSGIQFSTSAAEPCSISRRDNVWSEATSSESVEMLLKSVGQEEITPRETMEGPDACDELARLAQQMDPSLRHDDKVISNVENTADLQPPDETPEQFPLDNKVEGSQLQVEVQQSQDDASSIDGNLNPSCGNVIERITLVDEKFKDPVQEQIQTLDGEVPAVNTVRDKSTNVVQNIDAEVSVKEVCSSFVSLSHQSIEHDASHIIGEQHIISPKESSQQNDEFQVLRKDTNTEDQSMEGNMSESEVHHIGDPICSASKLGCLDVGNNILIGTGDANESTHIESSDNVHEVDRCKQHIGCMSPNEKSTGDVAMDQDVVPHEQTERNAYQSSNVAIEDDTTNNLPNFPNKEPKRDSLEDFCSQSNSSKVMDLARDVHQMHTDKSLPDAVSSVDDKICEVHEVNRDNFNALSSTASGPCESSMVGGPIEPCEFAEDDLHGGRQGVLDVMPVDGVKSTALSTSQPAECHPHIVNNNGGSISSDLVDVTPNDASEHDTISEKSDFTACETMDASLHSRGGQTSLLIAEENVKTDAPLGSTKVVSTELSANIVLNEAETSTSLDVLEEEASRRQDGTENSQSSDTSGQMSRKTSDHLLLAASTHGHEKIEPLATGGDVSTNVRDKDTFPGLPESIMEQDDGVQSSHDEQEKRTEGGDNEKESLKSSDVNDIPNKANHSEPLVSSFIAQNSPAVKEAVPVSQDETCPMTTVSNIDGVNDIPDKANHSEPLASSFIAQNSPAVKEAVPVFQDETCPMTTVSNIDDSTLKNSVAIDGNQHELLETRIALVNPDEMTSIPVTNNCERSSQGQSVPGSESIVRDATVDLKDAEDNFANADKNSFTFKVNPLEEFAMDVDKNCQSLPATTASKGIHIVESSPLSTGSGRKKPKKTLDKSVGSPLAAEGEVVRSTSKGPPDRRRKSTGKAGGKESSRKGSQLRDTALVRAPEKGDKASGASPGPPTLFQIMPSNEIQYGHGESSNRKPFSLVNASTSVPDLNTLTSSSVIFQQPFTDFQQVQLRAQIFVYGALIQGVVPDEAHMISAFGGPDGGRSIWENAWRACSERVNSQKSHLTNPETPLQPRSGVRTSDFAAKQNALQDKGASSSIGRANSQATPATVNPLIPLSSPLWSIPTPPCDSLQSSILPRGPVMDYQQTIPPLHPYHTPSLRSIGQNPSWISQSPLRGPWITSPQTPVSASNVLLSAPVVSDTVKLTPVKGSSSGGYSGIKNVTPGPSSTGITHSVTVGCAPFDTNSVTIPLGQQNSDLKSRKRKKNLVSEGHSLNGLPSRTQLEVGPTATVSHVPATGTSATHVGNLVKAIPENSVFSTSLISTIDNNKVDQSVDRSALSEESLNKVKEARTRAEEAAAFSAAAVSHSQDVWSQLDKQKSSGLGPDIEATLASAAVTVAAAVAVAKAACAAANVASSAALQAKLMADEAIASAYGSGVYHTSSVNNLEKATPASILKGANDGANSSSSMIVAAKQAAKRRVEAASAAAKRAENMDAIVKAAELAAEAVSQASKIVAMGDPLPLSDLAEAGPEGCWKIPQVSSEVVKTSNEMTGRQQSVGDFRDHAVDSRKNNQLSPVAISEKLRVDSDVNSGALKDHSRPVDGKTGSGTGNVKNVRGPRGHKVSGIGKSIAMGTEAENEPGVSSIIADDCKIFPQNIKEGSLVEVIRTEERFKAAWFMANVITVVDGKAYVCYTELLADDESGQLKEWVSLGVGGDKPPLIRVARPITGLHPEGTRKRRRAATGDYAWSVGDRVDAWIHESWWEGVITEKNKKDETSVTVHFPAQGETSVVRVWHLRPSLIWKEGNWIEWARLREDERASHEGDTPNEKRPRLGSPALDEKGKDKLTAVTETADQVNPDDLRLLDLAENERLFNIGKFNRNEKKIDPQRTVRSGLKKEGSRVVFGVPKPGKKRKFMEVSKHYVEDRNNKNNGADSSVRSSNYMMPQGTGSRGVKDVSKSDPKEKHVTGVKPKNLKPGKHQSVSTRTMPQRDTHSGQLPNDLLDAAGKIRHSANHLEAEGTLERASSSGPFSKKSLVAKSERANKGKLAPVGGKMTKIDEEKVLNDNMGKSTSEVTEPRRSNRRIQPTSRLLEGLQSSLIISKIPAVSHDKGNKNQSRHAPRGSARG